MKIESIPKLVKGRVLNSNGKGEGGQGLKKTKQYHPSCEKKNPLGGGVISKT